MKTTFRENSLWASTITTIIIFSWYFTKVFIALGDPNFEQNYLIGLFVGVMVLVTIIQIVMQTLLAATSRKEAGRKDDERERMIELKATRVSHYILVLGVWVTVLGIFFKPTALVMGNTILFFFVLSEIVGYVIQLIQYRRGI